MKSLTPEQVDALLPQTQCGLCTHGGCMPYAEAMVYEKAPINRCPPGGVKTLNALGELLNQDPAPYRAEMETTTKAKTVALIREAECIGCTKCIQVCPVDAIFGAAKQMHTIIANECTGCELCVPACPVDCIDLLPAKSGTSLTPAESTLARKRYQTRSKRLAHEANLKQSLTKPAALQTKHSYIQQAIARAKAKKSG